MFRATVEETESTSPLEVGVGGLEKSLHVEREAAEVERAMVRALPARVALEAFLAAAAGFTDDPPARDAFAVVLRSLTGEIFGGDLPRDVRKFSPGLQMDYIGRAVNQLVRENYLQLVVFPDFEAAVAALSQAVQRRAADTGSEFSICDESRAPDLVEGDFRVNDKELNAPVTVAMLDARLDARDATNKRDFETMLSDNNTVYADINGKWREVNVLCHRGGMICVAWTGGESQQRHSMDLPRGKVRTLEEHNDLKGRFIIRQFPMLMRFFGTIGEVEQHQYIRMLASGVKSVAGDAYTLDVKAAAVERAISSIGMSEEMISAMFADGPQAPQQAVVGHVTAKLAEAIRARAGQEGILCQPSSADDARIHRRGRGPAAYGADHEENKSMHDPTLTMVERYLTLRLACSGPREEKLRALRRRKSGSAALKNYPMSCEAKDCRAILSVLSARISIGACQILTGFQISHFYNFLEKGCNRGN
ncbi:hypothetical protein AURANDRAFT_68073 [Aureococcus anophagefferens]|uniref:Uncharacterized protein n=1 Tax=Aureococcus anophagefferens TaxID=44056 RepID=F0YNE4_AURAN|nr:hypothetical protein AURANDRAFT_68073 [Aureococcus anophagefferens]EGB03370.1 hypothetical protein AURANDRAFT_68073 [Aureococcus anophagefferens]|eukprot:XP_009041943.1 hypothetical protein AURANDRAFT_68073 [Aureococcus anophagefferens]